MLAHKKIPSCKPLQATLKPKLAREYFFLQPKKNFKIFFLLLLKKLKHPIHKPTIQTTDTYRHDNRTTEIEAHAHNRVGGSARY